VRDPLVGGAGLRRRRRPGPAAGQLDEDVQRRRGATMLLVFVLLVALADRVSAGLRKALG
jgi:hypothetical protein